MTLFKSQTAQEIWISHNCHKCWQPDEAARREHGRDAQCPIQERALRTGRKPKEWDRNTRQTVMADAYKCNTYQGRPARVTRRESDDSTGTLFGDDNNPNPLFGDDNPFRIDVGFVPVEGWPDKPRKKDKGVDHQ